MSWIKFHTDSENFAAQAEAAIKDGHKVLAEECYRSAAEEEVRALDCLTPDKVRTIAITSVSAASLWYKACDYLQCEQVTYRALSNPNLPSFAAKDLQSLLQTIWNTRSAAEAGLSFTDGEVLVSVSGGVIMTGGAPLDLILRKVDEVGRLFYRTVEMLLEVPFRRRGMPTPEIQEQFKPWLFQAPAGSYQFAVRIEKPLQMDLWPNAEPSINEITSRFLDIIKATTADSEDELKELVPKDDYREAFLKLTRNLTPTGKLYSKVEIKSSGETEKRPIVLEPYARMVINNALKKPRIEELGGPEEKQLRGTLRGLQLDKDWIEVNLSEGECRTVKIVGTGDVIDDVVGPMVNHRVLVNVVTGPKGKLIFRDIQPDD